MNIHPTAIISPGAKLAEGVTVGPFAVIEDNVAIGRGTVINAHVVIKPFVEIGEDNVIYQFASIGEVPQDLKFGGEQTKLVIGNRNRIREYCTLNRGTQGGGGVTSIGDDNFMMAYAHVAHDCHVGSNIVIANAVQMGGHVTIEDHAIVGGLAAVHQFVKIGTHSMIGGGSAVSQDVAPYSMVAGNRAELHGLNLIGLSRRGFSPESISALKMAYKIIFKSGLILKEARAKVEAEVELVPEVKHLLDFISSSERGVIR
ncbi:MAG TPA: acyl-ACP--UDP-N-acetylglucosamine O-acyltransferase [Nitrospirota bacterium]